MALKLITAASVLPVSLAEAKLACRFDGSELDSDITEMIVDAANLTAHEGGKELTQRTFEVSWDAFPDAVELTRIPVASITSVKYVDTAGVLQTLDPSAYALDNADDNGFAYVVPAYGTEWPATRDEINAVRVRYVAGYADAASVPSHLKRQVKIFVAMMLDDASIMADRIQAIEKVYAL